MPTSQVPDFVESYKGFDIVNTTDAKFPVMTVQNNVPVIGVIQTGHKTVKAAKKFVDAIEEQSYGKIKRTSNGN